MSARDELDAVFRKDSDALAWFQALGRGEKYKARQALYGPGTLLAIPLFTGMERSWAFREVKEGDHGLVMIRYCNWLGNILLLTFDAYFEQAPSLEQAREAAQSSKLWSWKRTADLCILAHHWPVLGLVEDPWDESQWREPAAILQADNPGEPSRLLRLIYEPRRRPREVFEPLTPELEEKFEGLPEWHLTVSSTNSAVVMALTLALTHYDHFDRFPIGEKHTASRQAWRDRHMATEGILT